MQSCIVVTPRDETCANLSFSRLVLVTAPSIPLHGIPEMPRLIALWMYYVHQPVQRASEVPDAFQIVHTRVVLHRFNNVRKRAKRSDVICSRHAVERGQRRSSVSQTKPFETSA